MAPRRPRFRVRSGRACRLRCGAANPCVMEVIDLTHTVGETAPVYPGDPIPQVVCLQDMPEAEFALYEIRAGTHAGTHMDAPRHMLASGLFAAEIPVDRLFGRGVLVDAR